MPAEPSATLTDLTPFASVRDPGPAVAPRALSLRRNFSWTFAGNAVYAGCQWGMLVVLAKLGSPEMVGQFALGLAVTAPIMMFANLQIRAILATDVRHQFRFGDYFALRLITTALASLVICAVAIGTEARADTVSVILAVGAAKAIEAVSDILYGLMQQSERMEFIARSMMMKGVLSLVILGVVVERTGSVFWGAVGLAGGWALLLGIYDIPVMMRIRGERRDDAPSPRWSGGTLVRLVWLALPLGLVMMLVSLNANIPRYFIGYYLGERELGIFAALSYLIVAGNTVVGALGQSATPRLARYFGQGEREEFLWLVGKLIGIGGLLGAVGCLMAILGGRVVLAGLYGPEYVGHDIVFTYLMVGGAISYMASFLGYAATAARCFRAQLPLFTLVSATTVFANLLLVPEYGLRGAAFAGIVSLGVQLGGSLWIVSHAVRRKESESL